MTIDDHSANKGLWTEIRRLSESLVDAHAKIDDLEEHDKDHELRLRASEERRFPLKVIAVYLSALSFVAACVAVWVEIH